MDINTLIQTLQSAVPQIAGSCCIVNGALMNLTEVQNMGYDGFSMRAKMNMPLKLYKYFPNRPTELIDKQTGKPIKDEITGNTKTINYSIQALRDNTVFMQSPSLFDDVYDSDIGLNYLEYEKARLLEYCIRCEIDVKETMETPELANALMQTIADMINSTGNIDFLFKNTTVTKNEDLSNQCFLLELKNQLYKGKDLGESLRNVIVSDFNRYLQYLQDSFRATCFATTPYSQLMWGGSYADCHRGFCVEYTVLPNDPQYRKLFLNLFPMIYCKVRPNMTEKLVKFQDKEPTMELLWDIYFHGVLRKSIDWAFQNEWRLLLPMERNRTEKDYCVSFFPFTKVFLGNRMSHTARKEVIDICHEKSIPYVGVTRNPDVFEMQECTIKCEDCPYHTNNIPK